MLCVCCETRWWASKDGSKSTVQRVFTSAAEKATFPGTTSVTAATVQGGKNVKASQWGRLLGLHPAPPQKMQSHSRTGNEEFSESAVIVQHWKTVLSPSVAQLSLQLSTSFQNCFHVTVCPQDTYTPLCRWWKDGNLLVGLWWSNYVDGWGWKM